MEIPNDEWTLVVDSPTSCIVQNTDAVTIALHIGSEPAYDPDDPTADVAEGEVMKLYGHSLPFTLAGITGEVWARALGPKTGYLYKFGS